MRRQTAEAAIKRADQKRLAQFEISDKVEGETFECPICAIDVPVSKVRRR